VIGTAPAGHPFAGSVGEGEAVRIFTGGVVPDEADTVVIQEDVEQTGDTVTLKTAAALGRHIRKAGLDFTRGSILAPAGRRLRARDLALLAAGDLPSVSVRRRPRVAFAATGDPGWPAYGTEHRTTRVYDLQPDVVSYPEETSMHLWERYQFDALGLSA